MEWLFQFLWTSKKNKKSSFSFSLFSLFSLGLNRCSDNCCEEKKDREKSKDEATILQLAGLDQHQGGRGDQVERNLGGQDDGDDDDDPDGDDGDCDDDGDNDDGDDDEAHPKQVDDCRSVRAGKIKAAIEQFQLGFNYSWLKKEKINHTVSL